MLHASPLDRACFFANKPRDELLNKIPGNVRHACLGAREYEQKT